MKNLPYTRPVEPWLHYQSTANLASKAGTQRRSAGALAGNEPDHDSISGAGYLWFDIERLERFRVET